MYSNCTVRFSLLMLIGMLGYQVSFSRYMSANMEDGTYFDNIQFSIEGEVEEAREILVDQAKVVEVATRNFAASKLKQNFFKALRYLAERELESISMQNRLRQPRQEEELGSVDVDDIEPVVPLVPVVANFLKSVIAGDVSKLNLTRYLESASKLVRRPVQAQITGLTKLLGITQPPEIGSVVKSKPTVVTESILAPASVTTSDHYIARLLKEYSELPEILVPISNISVSENRTIASVQSSNITSNVSTSTANMTSNGTESTDRLSSPSPSPVVQSTTEPEVTGGPGIIYIDILAKDIQAGLDGLLKAMPDIFKGAKEALTLLEAIRDIYDS